MNKNWGYDGKVFVGDYLILDLFDWDFWLGMVVEMDYYFGVYYFGNWWKMVLFGMGILGDMGVYIFDMFYVVLEFIVLKWVWILCCVLMFVGYLEKNFVEYEFFGICFMMELMWWIWYDGGFVFLCDLELLEGFNLLG